MAKKVVDIVNFNPDASCLESKRWNQCLSGGKNSEFYRWLDLYVQMKKRVVLGLTGVAVADAQQANPEALDLIKAHREIFDILVRPFSHDVALLRSPLGFQINLDYGLRTLIREFGKQVTMIYLPPEFMLTSEQVSFLSEQLLTSVLIHGARFGEKSKQIPKAPFFIYGLDQKKMGCIPISELSTRSYLNDLSDIEGTDWNEAVRGTVEKIFISWRDGESVFFFPDGLKREKSWLTRESSEFERVGLSELNLKFSENSPSSSDSIRSYPRHSFSPWLGKLSMLGFVQRLHDLEKNLETFSHLSRYVWLSAINSDILSSVEKESPRIILNGLGLSATEYILYRSDRGFEGDDYLQLLERSCKDEQWMPDGKSSEPHRIKLYRRINYLKLLDTRTRS